MKILIFNQDWFATELRELGHEVLTCGFEPHLEHKIPCKTNNITAVLAGLGEFSPDVILWHDNSVPTLLMTGLESCPIPTVFYSVDTHHHHALHSYIASIFDHVLVAQRDYLHLFANSGTPTTWLPLWAPRFVKASDKKMWPATFVGNLNIALNPRRVKFFEHLERTIPIHITRGNYWEVFPFADIVVNQTVKGDLNFRVFEAMMCGALLLTEKTPNGLFDLFTDGEHLVTYTPDDVEEATDKIAHLLAAPEKMRAIARAGREEILAKHTAMSRALTVNSILCSVSKRPPAKDHHFIAMVNHALSSFSSLKNTGRHCLYALPAAIIAAQAGLADAKFISETQVGHLIRACLAYDLLTGTAIGAAIIAQFAAKLPTNQVLALAAIRTLLNSGRKLEAEVIASTILPKSPQSVFKFAEEAIQSLLSAGLPR